MAVAELLLAEEPVVDCCALAVDLGLAGVEVDSEVLVMNRDVSDC